MDTLLDTLGVEPVYLVAKLHVSGAKLVINRKLVLLENIKIALQKHAMVKIIIRDYVRPSPLRHFIIELLLENMIPWKKIGNTPPNFTIMLTCSNRSIRLIGREQIGAERKRS